MRVVYQSLIDKLLISGNIDYFCGLTLTLIGKKVLQKALLEEEKNLLKLERKEEDKKRFKRDLLIAIVSTAIGSIITWLLMKY